VTRSERVRRLVDGELDAVEAAALRAEAARDPALAAEIEAALDVVDALRAAPAPPVPDDLVDGAVLRAVQRAHAAPPRRRALPRLHLHPAAWVGLGAAAALALALWARRPSAPPPEEAAPAPRRVEFALPAEGARTVAVAGDFNEWRTDATVLRDDDGDGVFVGAAELPPGSHAYMFVVDGERWVSDPYATNFRDDGFGHRNAIVRVD